jgi:hypothetical protein
MRVIGMSRWTDEGIHDVGSRRLAGGGTQRLRGGSARGAKNPEDELSLQLLKDRWDRPHRTGSTKGTGKVSFAVRTQGEMRILVTAPAPTPYQLLVWSGDEIKLPMRSPFMPMPDYRKRHPEVAGGVGGYALWTFAALLVVVAGLGGALIMVKRGRS